MNKDTSLFKDIFYLKQNQEKPTLSIKELMILSGSLIAMFGITILFGHLTKMIEDMNYAFLMTMIICLIIYISSSIHLESKFRSQIEKEYPLWIGLLPNLWAVVGPYILSLSVFVFFLDDLIGILVRVVVSVLMTVLVVITIMIRKLPNISFYRFLMKSIAIYTLLYLMFSMIKHIRITDAFMISFMTVFTLDLIRMRIEAYYDRNLDLTLYFKHISRPYFMILLVFTLILQAFLTRQDDSNLFIFNQNPIVLQPKIKHTIEIEQSNFFNYQFRELNNKEFAITLTGYDGFNDHYIYNSNYEMIYHIRLQGYEIVHGSPYIFTKTIGYQTMRIGVLKDFESDIIFYEEIISGFVGHDSDFILIYPLNNQFEIILDDEVTSYYKWYEDNRFEFSNDCVALKQINGVYQYFTCHHQMSVMGFSGNPSSSSSVNYHNGLLINQIDSTYTSYEINNLNKTQSLRDIKGDMAKFNYDGHTILAHLWYNQAYQKYSPNSNNCIPMLAMRLDTKGRMEEKLLSCHVNMFIANHDVFLLRRTGAVENNTYLLDVVDGYDMSIYAIRDNQSIMTFLFTPMFMICFMVLNGVQFKKVTINKFNLFD